MAADPTINLRHEMRTPIQMILGFCEVLLNSAQALSPAHRSDVEAIYRNAQQLASLVETLTTQVATMSIAEDSSPIVVLDSDGAVYELFREYINSYTLIHAESAEEIGQLGSEINPV